MANQEVYINLVLSQIQQDELKTAVYKLLREELAEREVSEEELTKLADPVKLGRCFTWLYNLVDLY